MTEQEARDYVNSVDWCFAKTYLNAPHEYTVGEWKPELHDKMIEFARYIRENGKVVYFYTTPYIKLFLDDYQYWTMDKNIEDTILINRTFSDETRCNVIKKYTLSDKYLHLHHETLAEVEQRAIIYSNQKD